MARTNKKRKLPVTIHTSHASFGSSSLPISASSKVTKGIIRRFHVLQKERTKLLRELDNRPSTPIKHRNVDGSTAGSEETRSKIRRLKKIDDELARMGGLERYQAMSAIGQSTLKGGGSERVLIRWLREMKKDSDNDEEFDKERNEPQRFESPEHQKRLRLLDVGALKHDNYAKVTSFVDATPIDLHSRHPEILERDFLTIVPGSSDDILGHRSWDVISLSLVLNFVPDPKERGKMLRLAHALLKPNGLLFIVLPLPCVLNSRYLTQSHWISLMDALGFESINERWKRDGKVGYWLFRKRSNDANEKEKLIGNHHRSRGIIALKPNGAATFTKKSELNPGATRNNFYILM